MSNWTLDDIPWERFDAEKCEPRLVNFIKSAAMVEYNGYDYAKYLISVFRDEPGWEKIAAEWAEEEVQHGRALRKWAELADPAFDFEKSFEIFRAGVPIPVDMTVSKRGSKTGELISRCVVETGTSSIYSTIKDHTDEPVLKILAAKIAADEMRHYKMFYSHLKTFLAKEKIGFWRRLRIVLARMAESEDDELAYALYSSNVEKAGEYDHKFFKNLYFIYVSYFYTREHVERMGNMLFKAVGLKPHTRLNRLANWAGWNFMQRRAWLIRRANGRVGYEQAANFA